MESWAPYDLIVGASFDVWDVFIVYQFLARLFYFSFTVIYILTGDFVDNSCLNKRILLFG